MVKMWYIDTDKYQIYARKVDELKDSIIVEDIEAHNLPVRYVERVIIPKHKINLMVEVKA